MPGTITSRLAIVTSILLAIYYAVAVAFNLGSWKQKCAAVHIVMLEIVFWQTSAAWSEARYKWPDQKDVTLSLWEATGYIGTALVLLTLLARQSS